MSKIFPSVTLVLLFLSFHLYARTSVEGSMEYSVSMPEPQTHYFEVEIRLKNYKKDFVDFKLPVWTPGSYLVREYAKNVEGFQVFNSNDQNAVSFQKTRKNVWRIQHKGVQDMVVRYRVYAFEGQVRMSYLDESHAFIMANTLLMYVDDLKDASSVLRLNVPDKWQSISTSLTKIQGQSNSFYIPNYDILVDSPIEIGNHEVIEFVAAGVPHEIAMYGKADYNPEKLKRDLTKIIEESSAIFDENPNEKYVFIVHNSGKRGGGLEHMSSTVLGVNRDTYLNDKSYNSFLGLAAHEYFHLWLVKRLKPVELEIIDYENEVYTDLLWVMEGLTSYFEEKIMLRCGFVDKNEFLDNMLKAMAYERNTPGARVQSVTEASFDAWIKYYRKNENTKNTQISYYSKGMLLGALLDLEIINSTQGDKSLDDVINQLYYQFYKKRDKGITNLDLKKIAEKTGNINLDAFFNHYVYGTEYLDNEKYLYYAGIGLIETNSEINSKSIGITYETKDNQVVITSILRGSSAYDNGLNVGDELIAINGLRINPSNMKSILDRFKVKDNVKVLYSRDSIIGEKTLDIRRDDSVAYTYEMLDNTTRLQDQVSKAWLGQ